MAVWKIGKTEICHTPESDYPYRAVELKDEWVKYIAQSAVEINYDNLKNAALKDADDQRTMQYHEVWTTMAGWEDV